MHLLQQRSERLGVICGAVDPCLRTVPLRRPELRIHWQLPHQCLRKENKQAQASWKACCVHTVHTGSGMCSSQRCSTRKRTDRLSIRCTGTRTKVKSVVFQYIDAAQGWRARPRFRPGAKVHSNVLFCWGVGWKSKVFETIAVEVGIVEHRVDSTCVGDIIIDAENYIAVATEGGLLY